MFAPAATSPHPQHTTASWQASIVTAPPFLNNSSPSNSTVFAPAATSLSPQHTTGHGEHPSSPQLTNAAVAVLATPPPSPHLLRQARIAAPQLHSSWQASIVTTADQRHCRHTRCAAIPQWPHQRRLPLPRDTQEPHGKHPSLPQLTNAAVAALAAPTNARIAALPAPQLHATVAAPCRAQHHHH